MRTSICPRCMGGPQCLRILGDCFISWPHTPSLEDLKGVHCQGLLPLARVETAGRLRPLPSLTWVFSRLYLLMLAASPLLAPFPAYPVTREPGGLDPVYPIRVDYQMSSLLPQSLSWAINKPRVYFLMLLK